jgi:hypothetical protein
MFHACVAKLQRIFAERLSESGFPVFLITYSDIFYFLPCSLITDKLPKEEKYNLFRIRNRKIPKTKFA